MAAHRVAADVVGIVVVVVVVDADVVDGGGGHRRGAAPAAGAGAGAVVLVVLVAGAGTAVADVAAAAAAAVVVVVVAAAADDDDTHFDSPHPVPAVQSLLRSRVPSSSCSAPFSRLQSVLACQAPGCLRGCHRGSPECADSPPSIGDRSETGASHSRSSTPHV